MSETTKNHKGLLIGAIVAGLLLTAGSVAASTAGWGVPHPPSEEQRTERTRHGGMFFIFYSGGGYGQGARGVAGRAKAGGGFGRGK